MRRWECLPGRGNSSCRGPEAGGGMLRVSKEQVGQGQCEPFKKYIFLFVCLRWGKKQCFGAGLCVYDGIYLFVAIVFE